VKARIRIRIRIRIRERMAPMTKEAVVIVKGLRGREAKNHL
jgi:hypothetical protein